MAFLRASPFICVTILMLLFFLNGMLWLAFWNRAKQLPRNPFPDVREGGDDLVPGGLVSIVLRREYSRVADRRLVVLGDFLLAAHVAFFGWLLFLLIVIAWGDG